MSDLKGFDELEDILKEYSKQTDTSQIIKVLEVGANMFVSDLLKLPKPKSKISKAGYTHLVDVFASNKNKNQIEVGWGKYYGPIVESKSAPHLRVLFNKNKEKYYQAMIKKIN